MTDTLIEVVSQDCRLLNSLLNGHIGIDQINLLIFDEAHHAKKEHPYARYVAKVLVPRLLVPKIRS
jgi:ERCC4-related helicase